MKKKAVILINVGTPDRPEKKEVKKYLSEFLNDPHVIDIPWLARKILVNLIIVPFRTAKSTKLYKRLWTSEGSPLLIYLENLVKKLNNRIPENIRFFGAMRYGNPSIADVIKKVSMGDFDEWIVLPLYPQYASSTTATVQEAFKAALNKLGASPPVRYVGQFYDHEAFLNAFESKIRKGKPATYDHILFSYHGLPDRHLEKIHPGQNVKNCSCKEAMPEHGRQCYKATCYETTRRLADRLNLSPDKYSVAFQSRLSKNWLSPFSDDRINELAESGVKRLLVAAPSFIADCLETTIEIGEDYNLLFQSKGGEKLTLVSSLNDDDEWVEAILKITELVPEEKNV
jgi:ferrochelatase